MKCNVVVGVLLFACACFSGCSGKSKTADVSKEVVSHFISLFSANLYPETLVFVAKQCKPLYDEVMSFILDV